MNLSPEIIKSIQKIKSKTSFITSDALNVLKEVDYDVDKAIEVIQQRQDAAFSAEECFKGERNKKEDQSHCVDYVAYVFGNGPAYSVTASFNSKTDSALFSPLLIECFCYMAKIMVEFTKNVGSDVSMDYKEILGSELKEKLRPYISRMRSMAREDTFLLKILSFIGMIATSSDSSESSKLHLSIDGCQIFAWPIEQKNSYQLIEGSLINLIKQYF